jgi:hypothetical protein
VITDVPKYKNGGRLFDMAIGKGRERDGKLHNSKKGKGVFDQRRKSNSDEKICLKYLLNQRTP